MLTYPNAGRFTRQSLILNDAANPALDGFFGNVPYRLPNEVLTLQTHTPFFAPYYHNVPNETLSFTEGTVDYASSGTFKYAFRHPNAGRFTVASLLATSDASVAANNGFFYVYREQLKYTIPNEVLSLTAQVPWAGNTAYPCSYETLPFTPQAPNAVGTISLGSESLTLTPWELSAKSGNLVPTESLALTVLNPQYRPLTDLLLNEVLALDAIAPASGFSWRVPRITLYAVPLTPQYDQIEVEYGHADVALTLPDLVLAVTGNDNDNSRIALTLPAPEISIRVGAVSASTLPAPVLTATADSPGYVTVALELPDLSLSATALTGEVAAALLELPELTLTASTGAYASLSLLAPQLTSLGSDVALARVEMTLPFLELTANAKTGAIATITLELPEFEFAASGKLGGVSTVHLTLPALRFIATASYAAPGADPVAVATETTYAINLNTGAVTNLLLGEFDKLITAHGRLYGLRNGALVRLDGDVDGTSTLIPATIRFAPQQFGTLQAKRVSDVYLNSREDDGVTLTLVQDEMTTWRYQTPTDKAPALGTHKVKVGRGVTFHSMGLILQNRNGGRMDIGGMELLVQPLSRKPR